MNLVITPKITTNFCGADKTSQKMPDSNPISRTGETANLVKATFIAGLGLGSKLLFELLDGDFLFDHIGSSAGKIVDKNMKDAGSMKKAICTAGGTFGLLTAAVAIFAIAYTLFKSPNIAYESKVNSFKKGKEMDVFIKRTDVEKGIYEKMNEEAQNGGDKQELSKQYTTMQLARISMPDFIKDSKTKK